MAEPNFSSDAYLKGQRWIPGWVEPVQAESGICAAQMVVYVSIRPGYLVHTNNNG